MKIDMHCHVSCGSIDSFVSIGKTIELLKAKGYNGMVITDHNSYKALKTINKSKESKAFKKLVENFSIFIGVEYDTSDAGHVLIILPNNIMHNKLFERRGMCLENTIKKVQELGGVVGLAHPYAHGRFGISWFIAKAKIKRDRLKTDYYNNLMSDVDFVEVSNGTVPILANANATQLAKRLGVVGVGGSDSHRSTTVGLCSTVFEGAIKTNDDLIQAIKGKKVIDTTCEYSKLSKCKVFNLGFKVCECVYYWTVTLAHKTRLKVSKK